jgi:nitrogen fixation NifU-like protein
MGGMDDLYREQILEHHRRPHNQGTLAAPSISLEGRNPNCGDVINLQLQVSDAGVITDVAFLGKGCAISQAGTSLITDELRGKSLDEVLSLGSPFVMELLGVEVGPARVHCALLGLETTQKAIASLRSK